MKPDIIHTKRCDCTEENISASCFQATVKVVSRVKDLEARLKAVRRGVRLDPRVPKGIVEGVMHVTDSRNKNWRKP